MSENLPLLNPALRDFWHTPSRNKVLYGGRSSGKSWSVCAALVLKAQHKKIRILCARRYQSRIQDSVFFLIKAEIHRLGFADRFTCLKTTITCDNGSEFLFLGIEKSTEEIKSLERIEVMFIEESGNLTKDQWNIISPTIRAEGSEIILSFNPALPTDFMYDHFITNTPARTLVRKICYDENIFLTQTARDTIEDMKETDYELYSHVYLGEAITRSDDMVFNPDKWRVADFEPEPEWSGPHMGLDFGFSTDPTAGVECWVNGNTLYIRRECLKYHLELDHTALALKRAIPGINNYTVRADCARPESISYLQRHGLPQTIACKKWPGCVEDGVAHMRSYDEIVIHNSCKETAAELLLYRYKKDRLSGDVLPDIIDKNNHLMDAIRYALGPLIRSGDRPLIGFIS